LGVGYGDRRRVVPGVETAGPSTRVIRFLLDVCRGSSSGCKGCRTVGEVTGTHRRPRDEASDAGLFRALFEDALDAILIADDDRVYVDANRAACELFGLS